MLIGGELVVCPDPWLGHCGLCLLRGSLVQVGSVVRCLVVGVQSLLEILGHLAVVVAFCFVVAVVLFV